MPLILLLVFMGFVVGVGFSILLGLAMLSGGDIPGAQGSTVSPLTMVLVYVLGGVLGGTMAGVTKRLRGSFLGTVLWGAIFSFPLSVGSVWAYFGSWQGIRWDYVLLACLIIGGPLGFVLKGEAESVLAELPEEIREQE